MNLQAQSSNVGFFKNMFNNPKENESLLALKSMRKDYSMKLNIAFLFYLILTVVSDAVVIYEVRI